MVADLVRAVGDPGWTGEVDFEALELPAEYVGDGLQQRRGDAVWRVPFGGAWLYLLLLLEFLSGEGHPHPRGMQQRSCTSPNGA